MGNLGKYKKVIKLKEISELNISEKMKMKLINKELWKYKKEYLENLKKNRPDLYEKMRKARYEYYKRWRKKHPDYNREWLRKAYKKDPEKFREYQRQYWLKKSLSRD